MSKSGKSSKLFEFIKKELTNLEGMGHYDFSKKEVVLAFGDIELLPDYFHSLIPKMPKSASELYFDLPNNRFVCVYPDLNSETIVIIGSRKSFPIVASLIKEWMTTEGEHQEAKTQKSVVKNTVSKVKSSSAPSKKQAFSSTRKKVVKRTSEPEIAVLEAEYLQPDSNQPSPAEGPDVMAISRIQKRIKRKHSLSTYFKEYAVFENLNSSASGLLLWRKRKENKVIIVTADCHQSGTSGALLCINFYNIIDEYDFSNFSFDAFYELINTKIHHSNLDYISEADAPPDLTMGVYQLDLSSMTLQLETRGDGCFLVRKKKILFDGSTQNELTSTVNYSTELNMDDMLVFHSSALSERDELGRQVKKSSKPKEFIGVIEDGSLAQILNKNSQSDYLLGALTFTKDLF